LFLPPTESETSIFESFAQERKIRRLFACLPSAKQQPSKVMAKTSSYVIVTPARNEAQFIELTLKSVLAQKILPLKWVIVSDGSTDGTDEIVKKYASNHPWIELVRMPERQERDFAGKVHAFKAGYARVGDLDYEVVVSLDADISFDADYFSLLLGKLSADLTLGLVGTPFQEVSGQTYDYRFVSIEHVSGACQVFRRECFEAIGGYLPVKGGSIDHIAVISVRMKGWKTRTFTEKVCLHHREIGTAQRSVLTSRFKLGIKDYAVGNHPLWELFRTAHQMTLPPLAFGGLALGTGYFWALLRRVERPVSRDLIDFHRREQMQRLKKFLTGGSSPSTETAQRPADPGTAGSKNRVNIAKL
jgi:poly-beta-1,6-N-acetyl-D-glucosamine synthase